MLQRLYKGRYAFAVIALAIMCFGFATPAMADPETAYSDLPNAKLTKVILAPAGTDTSRDKYVFHFAGGGVVYEEKQIVNGEECYFPFSDGIGQDSTTIKKGDIVPTIPDVTLKGVAFNDANTLSNGQTSQAVVQKPLSEVLSGVTFPHAGVYTYVVTERPVATNIVGAFVNSSKAEYMLRIRVKNSNINNYSELGNTDVTVESITLQKTKDDNGSLLTGETEKVDPTYPTTNNGKIVKPSENNQTGEVNPLAGDTRGRNVDGFTFANEYVKGSAFQVKKLYDGNHSDRSKYSKVELWIYSVAATGSDPRDSVLTYKIEGDGVDLTETNKYGDGERKRLNGVYDIPQKDDYMVEFNTDGWACIIADLKEDSVIHITGVFGPYNDADESEALNGKDRRETISASGLVEGQTYYVIERNTGDYRPIGYVYDGEGSAADPRVNVTGMAKQNNAGDNPKEGENVDQAGVVLRPFELCVKATATGSATTVFVVNTIDESKVSVTGILIDNLPYVLMIGIPVAVFIALFALKRRRNAVE